MYVTHISNSYNTLKTCLIQSFLYKKIIAGPIFTNVFQSKFIFWLRPTTTKAICKFLLHRSFVLKSALNSSVRFYKFNVCQRFLLFKSIFSRVIISRFSIFSVFSPDSKFATLLLRSSYISNSRIIVKINTLPRKEQSMTI